MTERITNEDAMLDKNDLCGFLQKTTGEKCTNCIAVDLVKDYAADLLEARAELEKANKRIKELEAECAAPEAEEPEEDGCEGCIYIEDEFGGPCSDCCREDMRSDWYTPASPKKE